MSFKHYRYLKSLNLEHRELQRIYDETLVWNILFREWLKPLGRN